MRLRRFLACLSVAVMVAGVLGGTAGPAGAVTLWEFRGPDGGTVDVVAVAPSSPQTIYVTLSDRVGGSGISKSTDGGAHWADASTGLANPFIMRGLLVDPLDPNRAYVGTIGGVARTTNGGGMWSIPNDDLDGEVLTSLTINPDNPDILYAGTQDEGVWKTSNGGDTWKHKSSGLPSVSFIVALAVNANNPSTVYAATDDGMYKSTDSAATWTKKNSGLPANLQTVAVDPDNGSNVYAGTRTGVYTTTNSGTQWNASNSGIPSATRDILSMVIDPNNTAKLFVGTDEGGVFFSSNSGGSWTARNSGLDYLDPRALALDPSDPATVFAGTLGGLYKSESRGQAWSTSSDGLERTHSNSIVAHPTNSDIVYQAAEGGGVLKSADGGVTWNIKNSTVAPGGGLARAITLDPDSPSKVYVCGLFTDDPMAKSTNGASSWSFQTSADVFNCSDVEVSPADSDIVWATDFGQGAWRTTDGGAHWNQRSSGITDMFVRAIAPSPTGTLVAYAATSSAGVFKTTNGGGIWSPKTNGLTDLHVNTVEIDADDSSHVLAGTPTGIFESTNSGSSWSPKNTGITGSPWATAFAFDPTDTQVVYVGILGVGVFRSINGSDTWSDFNSGLPVDESRNINDLAVASDGAMVFAATSKGVYRRPV